MASSSLACVICSILRRRGKKKMPPKFKYVNEVRKTISLLFLFSDMMRLLGFFFLRRWLEFQRDLLPTPKCCRPVDWQAESNNHDITAGRTKTESAKEVTHVLTSRGGRGVAMAFATLPTLTCPARKLHGHTDTGCSWVHRCKSQTGSGMDTHHTHAQTHS